MNESVSIAANVGAVMDTIAAKMAVLKAPAEHVWELVVRQQIIIGWSLCAAEALCIVFCALSWSAVRRQGDENSAWYMPAILFSIIGTFLLAAVFIEALPRLLNPEYYALCAIMN